MSKKSKVCSACAECGVAKKTCLGGGGAGPASCPTEKMKEVVMTAAKHYRKPGVYEFARRASIQEAECYVNREEKPYMLFPVKPRLLEICEFAQKMGYKKLGLAFCIGLQSEARTVNRVFEEHGFETVSVVCKVGGIPKEEIGVAERQKIYIGEPETMCNPIAQAEVLNKQKTEFNVLLGLCVGHDSLFFKHAEAPTTVFAVKDRVSGHNPLAAVYTLRTYSQRIMKKMSN